MKVVERDPQNQIGEKGLGCSVSKQGEDKRQTRPVGMNPPSLQYVKMEAWSLTKFRMQVNRGEGEVRNWMGWAS